MIVENDSSAELVTREDSYLILGQRHGRGVRKEFRRNPQAGLRAGLFADPHISASIVNGQRPANSFPFRYFRQSPLKPRRSLPG